MTASIAGSKPVQQPCPISVMVPLSILAVLPSIAAYVFLWYFSHGMDDRRVTWIMGALFTLGIAFPATGMMALLRSKKMWIRRHGVALAILILAFLVNVICVGCLLLLAGAS